MAPRGEGVPEMPDAADIAAARKKAQDLTTLEQPSVAPFEHSGTNVPEAVGVELEINERLSALEAAYAKAKDNPDAMNVFIDNLEEMIASKSRAKEAKLLQLAAERFQEGEHGINYVDTRDLEKAPDTAAQTEALEDAKRLAVEVESANDLARSNRPKGHETAQPRGMETAQQRAARQRVSEMPAEGFGSTSPEQRAEMTEMQSAIDDLDAQINTVKGLIEANPQDWQNLVSANPELGAVLTMTGEDMNRARTDVEAIQSQSSFIGRLFSGTKRRELREAQGNLARMEENLSEAYNALSSLTNAAGEKLAQRSAATSPETTQVRGASYEVAPGRVAGRAKRVEEATETAGLSQEEVELRAAEAGPDATDEELEDTEAMRAQMEAEEAQASAGTSETPESGIRRGGNEARPVKSVLDVQMGGAPERAARQRVSEMPAEGFGSTSPEQRAEMTEMQSAIDDLDAQINTVKGLIEANPQDWQNLVSANPELGAVLTMTGEDMNRARTDVEAIQSQSSFIGRLFSGTKRRELREAQGNLARMEENLSEAYNALSSLTNAAGEKLAQRSAATSPETTQVRGASYEVTPGRVAGRAKRVEEATELNPEELAETQEMPAIAPEEAELSIEDLQEVNTVQELINTWPQEINSIIGTIAAESVSPEVAFDMLEEQEGFVDWISGLAGQVLDGVKDGRGKEMEGTMTIKAIRKNSSGKPTVYLQREDGKNLTMGFANFLKNNVE